MQECPLPINHLVKTGALLWYLKKKKVSCHPANYVAISIWRDGAKEIVILDFAAQPELSGSVLLELISKYLELLDLC